MTLTAPQHNEHFRRDDFNETLIICMIQTLFDARKQRFVSPCAAKVVKLL
jgi:hypothetical protein